jgi:hypothetical protein
MKRNRCIEEKEVIELYKTESIKTIAKKLNTYDNKISSILKKNGIKPKRKFKGWKKVNDTFFDIIDTEEKAYILGFFIADGCIKMEKDKNGEITHSRLCFSNSIDDEEIINHIHSVICPENKMIYTHNTKDGANRKPQITLQWTSKHMKDVLVNKYKITPRKTYDLNFEFPIDTIPENLFRHFVRGYIDGDGTFNCERLGFVFNSKKFAQQIINFFKKEFEKNKPFVEDFIYRIYEIEGKTTKYYKVSFSAGKGRRKLYEKILYENSTIFLKRKRNGFNKKRIKKKILC